MLAHDPDVVRDVLHTGYHVDDVLDERLRVAIRDRTRERDLSVFDFDGHVARIDVPVEGETIRYVFFDPLVGPLVPLRALTRVGALHLLTEALRRIVALPQPKVVLVEVAIDATIEVAIVLETLALEVRRKILSKSSAVSAELLPAELLARTVLIVVSITTAHSDAALLVAAVVVLTATLELIVLVAVELPTDFVPILISIVHS